MDPMEFLTTEDPFKVLMMQAVASRTHELQRKLDESRARLIANAVGKLFGD